MKFREILEGYDDDDFTPPELPEMILPAGTVVYHGTGAKFANSDSLESPCWVTTSFEVAKRFVDWHQHFPNGKRRVLQYVTTRPLTLLQIDDREMLDNLEEYYSVNVHYPAEMARGVLGLRSKDGRCFDGWMIEDNYREGNDIMLGDSGVLSFVKTKILKEAHHEHDKLDYKTQFAPLKKGDSVRVFHGFHDVSEALTAAKHGLSGAERADRRYSYEFSNNPKGLFVTMSLDVAKEFTSKVVMEFVAREDQLEAPVWPGGGYTAQGQAEQWFSRGAKGRAERAAKRREMQGVVQGYVQKDPEYLGHVGASDDPYKAYMLMTGREYQALYIGHLDPSAISAFWVSDDFRKDGKYSNWTRMTAQQFVERFDPTDEKNIKSNKKRRVFLPNEEFDPEKFKQAMKKMRQNPDDLFQGVVDHYLTDGTPRQKIEQFANLMEYYLWPKQLIPAMRWILKNYSKKA